MTYPLRIALATAILAGAHSLAAQTGGGSGGCSVGRGFECSEITAHSGSDRDRHNWLRAVVLWRRAPGRRERGPLDSAAQARAQERHRNDRRAAEDSGRAFLGGQSYDRTWSAAYTGFISARGRTVDTLFVMDQRFVIPRRDSALIVMVDEVDGPASQSRIHGTAWMPAQLDAAYWPKFWTSGDTTFSVMPRRDQTILRDALERIPAVKAFLTRVP